MSLWSEWLTNTGRPIHKWTHYFPIYERHFGRFVNLSTTFIEIGVSKGGSLELWRIVAAFGIQFLLFVVTFTVLFRTLR